MFSSGDQHHKYNGRMETNMVLWISLQQQLGMRALWHVATCNLCCNYNAIGVHTNLAATERVTIRGRLVFFFCPTLFGLAEPGWLSMDECLVSLPDRVKGCACARKNHLARVREPIWLAGRTSTSSLVPTQWVQTRQRRTGNQAAP
jgi:hypothetical protein